MNRPADLGAAPGPDVLLARRLAAQQLSGPPARDPVEVTGRLLAVQGQDPRGARLAIRARSQGLLASDIDEALTADRSLLITWLNRGTLHLVRTEDYWWLHDLTTPPLYTQNARRLAQEGVPPADADRGVAAIERALSADGQLTRAQLKEKINAAGVRTEGQALVHLLLLTCLRGIAVRGPMIGRDHGYVLVRDWLGDRPKTPGSGDRDGALAELAVRYLVGHGPATERDLAKWAGLPLRDARRGLSAIASRLEDLGAGLVDLASRHDPDHPSISSAGSGPSAAAGHQPGGSAGYWSSSGAGHRSREGAGRSPGGGADGSRGADHSPGGGAGHRSSSGADHSPGGGADHRSREGAGRSPGGGADGSRGAGGLGLPPPRLLGPFDPVLLGWTSREQITGSQQGIVTINGLFRPFAMVDGRATAIWSLTDGEVKLRPFAPMTDAQVAALEADAADVRRFLGLTD